MQPIHTKLIIYMHLRLCDLCRLIYGGIARITSRHVRARDMCLAWATTQINAAAASESFLHGRLTSESFVAYP